MAGHSYAHRDRRQRNNNNEVQDYSRQNYIHENNTLPFTQETEQVEEIEAEPVDVAESKERDDDLNLKGGILILLSIMICLPYTAMLWNSLVSGDGAIAVAKTILSQTFLLVVLTSAILLFTRVYLSRNHIFNWTLDQLNDSFSGTKFAIDPIKESLDSSDTGTQTDEKGDASETTTTKKFYQLQLKCARRQYLQLKRNFAKRFAKLKHSKQDKSIYLTQLQLKIPEMEKKVDLLLAEKEAIEKQYEEEKRRNRELINRFQRLQQQLGRAGQHRQTSNYY